ncbi:hypothetical protein [Bernardetia sp. MNP-M8]|uniref:hypothetical protein n=1 Tax=Bernardetia sp. MNP-M8 TaxID=3127470 RepID=UPI0030D19556
MNIHSLEKEKHKAFLAQNRIDPITGDALQANDKIVICANCKSAFLADSWIFMSKKHCNQNKTLKKIPKNLPITIKPKIIQNFSLIIETLSNKNAAYRASLSLSIPSFFFILGFYLINDIFSIPPFNYFFYIISLAIFFVPIFLFQVLSNYEEYLIINFKYIAFNKDRKERRLIPITALRHVKCYKSKRYWFYNLLYHNPKQTYTLKFILYDGVSYDTLINEKTAKKIKAETNLL